MFSNCFFCAPARHLLRRISWYGGQRPSGRHAAAAVGADGRLAAPAGQPQSFRASEPASQASTFPLIPGFKKCTVHIDVERLGQWCAFVPSPAGPIFCVALPLKEST